MSYLGRFPVHAARLSDVMHISPSEFGKGLLVAIEDALNNKYPNKIVPNLGLCVSLYDVTEVGESHLYPGNASHHTYVEFRLVMFKPFVGEVLDGQIVNCNAQGMRISLGFFDEVHVPSRLLQEGSVWSEDEMVWVWCVPDTDHQLFFDTGNPLRFKVEAVRFREPSNEAAKPMVADRVGESRSATPTPSRPSSQQASSSKADATTPPPTPGSSVHPPPKGNGPLQPAMQIIASMNYAGLGLKAWWPPDEDVDEEEAEDDEALGEDDAGDEAADESME